MAVGQKAAVLQAEQELALPTYWGENPNPTGTYEQEDYSLSCAPQAWQGPSDTAVSPCGHHASRKRWDMSRAVQDRAPRMMRDAENTVCAG